MAIRTTAALALLLALCIPASASADRWGKPGGIDANSPFRDTCKYDQNCGAKRVSDAVLGGSFVTGLSTVGLLTLDRLPYADTAIDPDPVYMLEPIVGWSMATLPTFLTWQIVRSTQRRPRPFTYDPDYITENEEGRIRPGKQRNATSSFFSGHTALTAANLFFVATASALDPEFRPFAVPLYIAATVGTASVGLARVQAGYHFVSDITIGGLVGAGFGIVGPVVARQIHERVQAARGKRGAAGTSKAELQVVVPLMVGAF